VLIGFSTFAGTVTAASDWDGPAERKQVRPALPESYEALFHDARASRFLLDLRDERLKVLHRSRLERAIGVVYRPESERVSHYFRADLPAQFDAILHFDETRAVEPLERAAGWGKDQEPPETFPSGI
jgi:erythromycin esterase-like protein